jgi:hypothetical protein
LRGNGAMAERARSIRCRRRGSGGTRGCIGKASADEAGGWRRSEAPRERNVTLTRANAVLLAAGDIGKCTDVGERGPYLTADQLAMRPEATILAPGDLAHSRGTALEFANCYRPTWGRFKDRTRPVPGNHEYRTAGASGYFGYWGPQARPDGHSYCSFDLGDWHLVALDTNLAVSADSAQVRWLRSDLAGSAARCKLAFFHHPRFSSGKHGNHPGMEPIFKILYGGRVSVVLTGHYHHYERFALLNPSGEVEPTRGVRSRGTPGRAARPACQRASYRVDDAGG